MAMNPYFVAEFETGYAVIGDYQFSRAILSFSVKNTKPNSTNSNQISVNFKRNEPGQKLSTERSNRRNSTMSAWAILTLIFIGIFSAVRR